MSTKQDIYLDVRYEYVPEYQLEAAHQLYSRKRRKYIAHNFQCATEQHVLFRKHFRSRKDRINALLYTKLD